MNSLFDEKLGNSLEAPFPELTPREITLPNVPDGKAHAVIGMRRAGKTSFLYQCLKKRLAAGIERNRLVYFNFEDERLSGLESTDMGGVLDAYYRRFPQYRKLTKVTFCFDEIQLISGWERFIRRVLDEENVEIICSGSSAELLSREIATSMRGRAMETIVTPYSFREFVVTKGHAPIDPTQPISAKRRSEMENLFETYLKCGGFPEAAEMDLRTRIDLLQGYVDIVLFRDVIERHNVSNISALRELTRHVIRNVGTQVSISKLYNSFRSQGISVTKQTLIDFYYHLEDCFLISTLKIDSQSERKTRVNPRKVYLADHSLASAFQHSPFANRGHHLENIIACELFRRSRKVTYVRTNSGYEVDFLSRDDEGNKSLVQVSADISALATRDRECRALAEAADEHPSATLTLITETSDQQINYNGHIINTIPAWKWLSTWKS